MARHGNLHLLNRYGGPCRHDLPGLHRIFKTAWVPINAHEAVFHEPKAEGNRLMITVQETDSDQTHQYFSQPVDAFDDLDPTEVVLPN
ncbi:MAG: hypothetical protein R2857_04700 [Vampirovibrionales bacterium]